jgi:hypothetical protein
MTALATRDDVRMVNDLDRAGRRGAFLCADERTSGAGLDILVLEDRPEVP